MDPLEVTDCMKKLNEQLSTHQRDVLCLSAPKAWTDEYLANCEHFKNRQLIGSWIEKVFAMESPSKGQMEQLY